MFKSLHSRLWLTYASLIAVILCVVGGTFLVYLLRHPAVYRQAGIRLVVAETALLSRGPVLQRGAGAPLNSLVSRVDETLNVRVTVFDPQGNLISDSRPGNLALRVYETPRSRLPLDQTTPRSTGDLSGNYWLYLAHSIPASSAPAPGYYLIVAVLRPRLALLSIFSEDLITPLAWAGGIALGLATVLALIMARWVTRPLDRVTAGTQAVSKGAYRSLPLEGPEEVQKLAHSFNQMSRQVQVSQQSQRDFVANVSHELKTPLTSVQGFAQAILDGTAATPDAVRQAAQVVYDEAGRMHRLVLDLLILARLEGGTADLKRVPLDLAVMLRDVAQKLGPQAERASVSLSMDVPALPSIQGDADRLAQVFTNLVDNALKFTPAGGSVSLAASAAGNRVQVRVRDTGPGIQPEDRERIFERFYQADRSRRGGAGRGAGLGLSIAREIILAHRGKIWVESEPGQGAEFFVELPEDPTADATQAQKKTHFPV